jgi:DNA-binding transcriptional regulator LsrR (DeoR family)
MSQIGERLGISRHRVGRLLREAIETGVVKIEIQSLTGKSAELEQALENAFGLKASLVVEVNSDLLPEDIKLMTCKAGAEFLRELIKAHHTIGVGWGTTTFELINQLEPLEMRSATVVQITGGNKRLSVQFDCHEVTRRLAQKLGVEPVLLHAPGIVDKKETRELLMRESTISETFRHFDKLDIVIVGIGAIVPEVRSMLIGSGYVAGAELKSLKQAGAVGDVFSYFINDKGGIVHTEIYDRSITIGVRQIRKVPTTVGIATGAEKSRAVAAAIRGGFVNTLIVDSLLAHALLTHYAPRPTRNQLEEQANTGRRFAGAVWPIRASEAAPSLEISRAKAS